MTLANIRPRGVYDWRAERAITFRLSDIEARALLIALDQSPHPLAAELVAAVRSQVLPAAASPRSHGETVGGERVRTAADALPSASQRCSHRYFDRLCVLHDGHRVPHSDGAGITWVQP